MQLNLLLKSWSKDHFSFGGSQLGSSHAKTSRPFRPKLALHVVMRSTKARGEKSLLRNNHAVARVLDEQSHRHLIKIYAAANAGNHLHLLIQAPSREHLVRFTRAITGRIAQLVDAEKGFWDARPFSRIVSWGRDFNSVARYIGINTAETIGMARVDVRRMFAEIRSALSQGHLTRSPNLVAAGFG